MAKGKRGMFSAFTEAEATQELSSSSVKATQELSKPTKKKEVPPGNATRKNYSLYPDIIKALERYAKDNYISQSAVITQALISYIPDKYFKE